MPSLPKLDFKDRKIFRDMVGWFDVTVLLDAAKRSIISAIFGGYADRRLMTAALDDITKVKKNAAHITDYRSLIDANLDNNDVWVDYVADLGDGFNSTYAIAHLIGRKELEVEGHTLPRAHVLIMGGDEVYPTATRNDYKTRLEAPYEYAHPDTELGVPVEKARKRHPLLFMIPGNHDWYDGLNLFVAKFCSGKGRLGNWRLPQTRSYFAAQIAKDWWILGCDTQLDEDIDVPQADYFTDIAARINKDNPTANIILCSSVPTWLKVDNSEDDHHGDFGKGIDYIATKIMLEGCPQASIYAVLSGDSHHYSRYVDQAEDVHFITAGGGGAFLHPTHHLKDNIEKLNWRKKKTPLRLAQRDAAYVRAGEDNKACFPDRKTSRDLAKGNLRFPLINKQFAWTLGGAYAVLAGLMSLGVNFKPTWKDLFLSPISLLVLMLLVAGVSLQADFSKMPHWISKICPCVLKWNKGVSALISDKMIVSVLHGFTHFALLSVLYYWVPAWVGAILPDLGVQSYEWLFTLSLFGIGLFGGFLGGSIWGFYLWIASAQFGQHHNDAFSAMRIADYKNFLRMHIQDDTLTIYSIGIDKVPTRDGWMNNDKAAENNGDEPRVLPKEPLVCKLIEAPIVIH